MARPGPAKKADADTLFEEWYNAGERRTYQQVAELASVDGKTVAERTIRRYADEFDWQGRADALDDEARRIRDKRLASLVAKHRAREIEVMASLGTKFFRRLMPSTPEKPNPAEILPGDISIGDALAIFKEFDRMTGNIDTGLGEGELSALDAMKRQIMQMDDREKQDEQLALPAGGGE